MVDELNDSLFVRKLNELLSAFCLKHRLNNKDFARVRKLISNKLSILLPDVSVNIESPTFLAFYGLENVLSNKVVENTISNKISIVELWETQYCYWHTFGRDMYLSLEMLTEYLCNRDSPYHYERYFSVWLIEATLLRSVCVNNSGDNKSSSDYLDKFMEIHLDQIDIKKAYINEEINWNFYLQLQEYCLSRIFDKHSRLERKPSFITWEEELFSNSEIQNSKHLVKILIAETSKYFGKK